MLYKSDEAEKDSVLTVAKLMATAARTAPKTRGVDTIETLVVDGEEKNAIAAEMKRIGESDEKRRNFLRDAGNVDASDYIVLIGVRARPIAIPNCGACGFADCGAMTKAGGVCFFNASDLGTAAASACAVAAKHYIDNRLMNTVGIAAQNIGLFSGDVWHGYGIPVSAKGKSVYFDR